LRSLGFDAYQRLSEAGGPVPVFRELPGDRLTPVSAFLALAADSPRAFLLESVVGGERLARYSFLGRDPSSVLEVQRGRVIERDASGARALEGGLLQALRQRVGTPAAAPPGLPRLAGGAVGYLAYDAVRLFERVPDRHPPGAGPLAWFGFYESVVAFDHAMQTLLLIADAPPGRRAAFERAQDELDRLEADLLRAPAATGRAGPAAELPAPGELFSDAEGFRRSVRRAQEHIAAGDAFQIVLSRQRTLPCAAAPFDVYRALRMVNPSPYMYFLKDGGSAVAGASPEMLVRVEGRRVETRPIAGTRPRGRDAEEDERLARELLADEKERAEHLMLVDLGRNDLGRVCRFDSVRTPEFMTVERYSHVTHLVSSVVGELAAGKDGLDALVAAFPAGTLTGAPKIRAMEIIDTLEPARRGLYGGTLGYIALGGSLDFCIAIRTIVMEPGRATIQAGAGIVADSDPEAERRETEAKAGAMLEALRLAATLS
jgi:anthranilate synthase component 1